MSRIRRNSHWILALGGVVCLAFAAGVMAQRDAAPGAPGSKAVGIADARDLSAAFRSVAKEALPGIVSIEVQGRVHQVSDNEESPFGDNSPFGELFKNEPRFKEMYKQRQRHQPRSHGMGSGFIIDSSGIILTNNHVVQDAEKVTVKLSDGRVYVGTDIKTDPRTDVAIVRIKADGKLPTLRMGHSDTTEIGDWVLAVGSPFGLDLSVTAGIISAKGRGPGITEREDFLQTDAAINPGNSGGPLLNLQGEVIGINTAISSRSGGYEGIGFAVPIDMARWVANQLIGTGNVSRGYLGVAMQPVDNEIAQQLHVPVGHGAVVTQVLPNSPAAGAKLEAGDLIMKLNGKDVTNPRGLQSLVEQLTIGETYPMVVLRNGKEVTLSIQSKAMPKEYSMRQVARETAAEPVAPAPAEHFDELGLGVEELTPELSKQLGYKGVSGVVISSVKENSPAASKGLAEGMVIEKVANKAVHSTAEFKEVMKSVKLDQGVLLLVRNQRGTTQFVVVKAEPAATPAK